MDNSTLAATLATELNNADNSEIQAANSLALRYYNAEPGEVAEGMSDLVSPDVRDAMESSMAEIMAALNGQDTLAIFEPETPDDVQMAELETRAVHKAIFGSNRGYVVLETAIRDAMLQRYGIIKVDADADDTQIELYAVAPENFRWSSDLLGPWLDGARFFAERCFHTRAELEEYGSRADAADAPENGATDEAFQARYQGMNMLQDAARNEDDTITAWYCYLRNNTKGGYDVHLFVEPSLIIASTWVEFHPYATGVATLRPHRFDGVSVFDRLQQIQSAKTYMLRQLAMQTKFASQARLAIRDKAVNPDDLMADELNPVIRCKGMPAEDLMPLPIQDVTSQILGTLQWLDNLRREDGGASIDMTTAQVQIAGTSAHAAERSYSVKELQTGLMLRCLGETLIRSLYLTVHATMRQRLAAVTVQDKTGEFMAGDPRQFPARANVTVDVGNTLGAVQRKLGALASVIQMQDHALQTGGAGILVTPGNIYQAQLAFAKLNGLNNAQLFWTDPTSPEAQQAAQGQAQSAEAAASREVDAVKEIEKFKGEIQLAVQHMKGQQDEATTRMQTEFDYFKAILDGKAEGKKLDIQEAQLILSQVGGSLETNREAATASE